MILHRDHRTDIASLAVDESILATQNNYLGVRANFEEDVPYQTTIRGTYINGFYDTHDIPYGEKAYGLPVVGQSMVNVPDAQSITIFIGDTAIDLKTCKLLELKRAYHLDDGYTTRSAHYQTMDNIQLWIHTKRLTHLSFRPLFMIDYTVESVNYEGPLTIVSRLNGTVHNYVSQTDMRAGSMTAKRLSVHRVSAAEDRGELTAETINTQFKVTTGLTHSVPFHYTALNDALEATKTITLSPHERFTFQKFALYYNDLDHSEIAPLLESGYNFVQSTKLDDIYAMQAAALKDFQSYSRIEIEGKDSADLNQTIAFSLYQLYTAGAHSPRTNIPAKGLTGEGYEGHTFWDTEIYMLPFFMQTDPRLALHLLEYRYLQLAAARDEARKLGNPEGVKYAWRTINGQETSSYYPASTAQYHINSDIAYAVIQYDKLYHDAAFMTHKGFEMIVETARFFKDVVHKHDGLYHIHHVTGPDEYNAVVDDNYYTNALLKYHLEFLIDYVETHECEMEEAELSLFKDIAQRLYLPFHEGLNIDLQDASFLAKKPVDVSQIPEDKRPLLLHYHPLTIYRFQVLKQADTVLSHLLLFNRPLDIMNDSFDFYESRTTHDSSLSYCIHATQAAKLGHPERAYDFFNQTVELDLNDCHKNTFHGLHLASLGGVYMAILYGFIGYQIMDPIRISPRLPSAWTRLKMRFRVNALTTVQITLTHDELILVADQDAAIDIHGTRHALLANRPLIQPNTWF